MPAAWGKASCLPACEPVSKSTPFHCPIRRPRNQQRHQRHRHALLAALPTGPRQQARQPEGLAVEPLLLAQDVGVQIQLGAGAIPNRYPPAHFLEVAEIAGFVRGVSAQEVSVAHRPPRSPGWIAAPA